VHRLLREPSHPEHEHPLKPTREQVLAELRWTIERAVEHLGEPRAARYLRKFYPWYVPRLQLEASVARSLQESLQTAATLAHAHELLDAACRPAALAV
jgi:tRNA-dihydrouridine synthase